MIALDTNVLIYCCDKRDLRRQQTALELVAATTDAVRRMRSSRSAVVSDPLHADP